MPYFLVIFFVNTPTLLPLCLFSQEPFQSMEATVVAEALKFLCDEECRCYKVSYNTDSNWFGPAWFQICL